MTTTGADFRGDMPRLERGGCKLARASAPLTLTGLTSEEGRALGTGEGGGRTPARACLGSKHACGAGFVGKATGTERAARLEERGTTGRAARLPPSGAAQVRRRPGPARPALTSSSASTARRHLCILEAKLDAAGECRSSAVTATNSETESCSGILRGGRAGLATLARGERAGSGAGRRAPLQVSVRSLA